MTQTDPSTKPPAAADLSAKLVQLVQEPSNTIVMVRWWKLIDDPALALLGGGIVTISTVVISAAEPPFIANDVMTIPNVVRRIVIPLADLLDIKFLKAGVTGADIDAFMGDLAHG
jgi:hypothetical protein